MEREKIIGFYKSKKMIYLARKANLANFDDDSLLIKDASELTCSEVRNVGGVFGFTVSFDISCISDIEVALTCCDGIGFEDIVCDRSRRALNRGEVALISCDGIGFEDIVCDRSRRALNRGEVACNNPLLIFKSSVGLFFYKS
jgi:hypothetical protein